MAEVEIGQMKVSGGKALILIPLLGTILGGMWGGFELYQRLLDAEQAVTEYVAHDMSGINQQLAVQAETVGSLQEDISQQFNTVTTLFESIAEDIDRVR